MSENIAVAINPNETSQAVEYKVIDWVDLPTTTELIGQMLSMIQEGSIWVTVIIKLGQQADLLQSLVLAGVANRDDAWFESLDLDQVLAHLSGAAEYNYTKVKEALQPFRAVITMDLSDLEIMAKHEDVTVNESKFTLTPVPFKQMSKMLALVDGVLYPLLALTRDDESNLTRLISASVLNQDFMNKAQWLIEETVREKVDFTEWALPDVLRLFAECVRINYRFFGKPFANMITAMLPKNETEPAAEA